MIDNVFVIDGIGHARDFSDANAADTVAADDLDAFRQFGYGVFNGQLESEEPGFKVTYDEWISELTAEDMAHIFFLESDVDIVVGHSVELAPLFKHGMFRWDTLVKLHELVPDRVLLYAGIDTFKEDQEEILDDMERAAAQGAIGFKFYPSNGVFDREANRLISLFYDDPEKAYPLFEKARQLGVGTVAFHKAQPVGVGPNTVVGVEDISTAAAEFPDLNFEVVHAGWAFIEDTAYQLQYHPNVYATLENTLGFVVNQPLRFAHLIGTLLRAGAEDRLIYGSGCGLNHPDPQIRHFWNFQMPQDLVDGYGYPKLTPEIKEKILGLNFAKLHNLDLAAMQQAIANDSWNQQRSQGKAEPWSHFRARLGES